ncbi:hypothetical protein GOODEAATRI_006029 [Goodea atripinnis]|uniref:Uncharacterized protein n=1 Tax=Goodea atripinnis TaxID=208336 RepID=A0ABV0NK81_9TELE
MFEDIKLVRKIKKEARVSDLSTFTFLFHFSLHRVRKCDYYTEQLPPCSLALKTKQIKCLYFSPLNEKINQLIPFKDAGVCDHMTSLFRFLWFIQQVYTETLSVFFAE